MEHDYKIESLSRTFAEHSEKAKENQKRDIEQFKENYPGQELPEFLKNDFCISTALSVMCFEIEKITNILGIKEIN